MTGCPPDVEHADKFVWGITLEGGMIGCADVIRGWPSADTAHIGLLLLTESYHGRGLGRRAYEAIEVQTRRWLRVSVIHPWVETSRLRETPVQPGRPDSRSGQVHREVERLC